MRNRSTSTSEYRTGTRTSSSKCNENDNTRFTLPPTNYNRKRHYYQSLCIGVWDTFSHHRLIERIRWFLPTARAVKNLFRQTLPRSELLLQLINLRSHKPRSVRTTTTTTEKKKDARRGNPRKNCVRNGFIIVFCYSLSRSLSASPRRGAPYRVSHPPVLLSPSPSPNREREREKPPLPLHSTIFSSHFILLSY